MNNELNLFLQEGVKRFKEASQIMVLFGKSIEDALQLILTQNKNWGNFIPDNSRKKRSTKYWDEYPLKNAEIFGTINNKKITLRIGINWYESNTDYPMYFITIQEGIPNELLSKSHNYKPHNSKIEVLHSNDNFSLVFYPTEDNFNLHRDFKNLIDEFVKLIEK